jgi:hypothetical protein
MKNLFLIMLVTLFLCCTNSENKKNNNSTKMDNYISVSFELGQKNLNEGIIVAYTNDADSLWLKEKWVIAIKSKMENLSPTYSTVLLFNKKENMPNVASTGINYSLDYDKNMVCGYWIYPNGNKKFCFGGVKSDGNFKKCE